jgi:hypothetical protein
VLAFLIALLGFFRFLALDKTIGVLNDYIQKTEQSSDKIGWTAFYRDKRTVWMACSRWFVWSVLLFLTCFFAGVVLCKGPFWIAESSISP